jgi:hypothetical protein
MPLGDLFKSKREREKDQERNRRRAFRKAEGSVDAVKDRVAKLKKERDTAWQEARQYLKAGQKAASMRSLQTVRASDILAAKLEMKRWVFEQLLSKLELAKSDQEFAQSLAAINTVVQIDPDAVADVLGEVEDKLGDQVDTDKIWEKMYGKEMEGVQANMMDIVPSLDDMAKDLETEVSDEMGTERPAKGRAKAEREEGISDQIGDARKRLRGLMEDDK